MARITVEDCIDKFPSRFELVLVASQRARKLDSGENPTIDKDNDKNTVIALREIAEASISVEDMKESLISEYQTLTITDEEDENTEISSKDELNKVENETSEDLKNASNQIEEEIKELTTAEDSELEEEFEINDDILNSNDSSSSENDETDNIQS